MVVEYDKFKMEKLEDLPFYNLSILSVVNAGKENERKEFKVIGYGMPFDSCIRRIVDYEMSQIEGTYTIKEYIDKYEELVNKIGNEFE
jgi:hypothetical protein